MRYFYLHESINFIKVFQLISFACVYFREIVFKQNDYKSHTSANLVVVKYCCQFPN
jgi:hypothetical protein